MKPTLKPFTIDYYEQVLELWQQAEGVGLNDADSKENIEAYLDRNSGMSMIAVHGKKVVGVCLAGTDGRRGYINHLAVSKHHRNQGIGSQLVSSCLGALKKAGISKCHLFIYHGNEAGKRFWNAIGWTLRDDLGICSKVIEE